MMNRFRKCPLCGEHCDIDEHTECKPKWIVSSPEISTVDGTLVYADTAEKAATQFVASYDKVSADGTLSLHERSKRSIIIEVTGPDGDPTTARILVTSSLVPHYTAYTAGGLPDGTVGDVRG